MQWSSVKKLVVLPHTLFGLPWLVTSAALVYADPLIANGPQLTFWRAFWMVVAFCAARVAGMSFNRLIDRKFDSLNSRTRDRGLVTGEISVVQCKRIAWGSAAVLVGACAMINTTCLMLAPALVALLWGYSYVKRVTSWYHFAMALNHFFLPIFVWAALTNQITIPAVFLGTAMLALICANDIVYGIQDETFDLEHGLQSVATTLGSASALWVAFALHIFFLWFLVDVGMVLHLPVVFYVGIAALSGLVFYLDRQISIEDPQTINDFMFRCNVWVGFSLMVFSIVSVLWLRLS